MHRFTTSIGSTLIELLRYDVHPIRTRFLKYLYHQDPEQYNGQYRRLLSTTAVRAQAMCLLARVGLVTPAAKEAAGRRELAMRLSEAMKRERRLTNCILDLILLQFIFHSDFDDLVI